MGGKSGSKPRETVRKPNGHFAPGTAPGPGRPKGFDFKKALCRFIDENDYDIDEAAGRLALRLFELAMDGDMQAARIWLDRCYGPVRQEIDHTTDGQSITGTGTGPEIPTGERLDKIVADLVAIRSERLKRNGTE